MHSTHKVNYVEVQIDFARVFLCTSRAEFVFQIILIFIQLASEYCLMLYQQISVSKNYLSGCCLLIQLLVIVI